MPHIGRMSFDVSSGVQWVVYNQAPSSIRSHSLHLPERYSARFFVCLMRRANEYSLWGEAKEEACRWVQIFVKNKASKMLMSGR